MFSKIIEKISAKVVAVAGVVGAFLLTVIPASAQTVYDFSSSTEEIGAMRSELVAQGWLIALGTIASIIVLALALMGAGYVWGKFKKFTGISKKI